MTGQILFPTTVLRIQRLHPCSRCTQRLRNVAVVQNACRRGQRQAPARQRHGAQVLLGSGNQLFGSRGPLDSVKTQAVQVLVVAPTSSAQRRALCVDQEVNKYLVEPTKRCWFVAPTDLVLSLPCPLDLVEQAVEMATRPLPPLVARAGPAPTTFLERVLEHFRSMAAVTEKMCPSRPMVLGCPAIPMAEAKLERQRVLVQDQLSAPTSRDFGIA